MRHVLGLHHGIAEVGSHLHAVYKIGKIPKISEIKPYIFGKPTVVKSQQQVPPFPEGRGVGHPGV